MEELLARIDGIERKLDRLLEAQYGMPKSDWIDARELCRLVGLRDPKSLMYLMSKGAPSGDAVRNIGTAKRPRYRFHRTKAVDQIMKRL